jgi:hypothetical protein
VILKYFNSYKLLGRKYLYSPERVINLKEHDIEIWQGFRYDVRNEISTPSFGSINGPVSGHLPLLNVDVDFLIVRQENCLDTIREVRKILIDSERQAFESAFGVSLLQQFDEVSFLKTN